MIDEVMTIAAKAIELRKRMKSDGSAYHKLSNEENPELKQQFRKSYHAHRCELAGVLSALRVVCNRASNDCRYGEWADWVP